MKKNLSILLLGAFLMTMAIGLTGCEGMVTERQLKSMIEDSLKEKYKEEFKCIGILPNQNFSGSYTGVCYPVKDRKLMFEAKMFTEGRLDKEHYPTSIAARELSRLFDDALGDIWGTHFTYAYSSLGIDDDETAQKIIDGEFTLEFFLNRSKEIYETNSYNIYYRICVDTSDIKASYDDEWNTILYALDKIYEFGISHGTDLNLTVDVYFVPPKVYNDCIKYLERNAEVRSGLDEIAEGFPQKYHRLITINFKHKDCYPAKDEYVKLRKEID